MILQTSDDDSSDDEPILPQPLIKKSKPIFKEEKVVDHAPEKRGKPPK